MDPHIENIILGVIANAITSILTYIGEWGGKLVTGEELLQEMERQKTALDPVLQKAIETVSEELDWENPEIHLFLASPEVESIVRQVFSVKASRNQERRNHRRIRHEFQASLALYLEWPENRLTNSAKVLFDALLSGCDRVLAVAVDQGILSAHEAKSAVRHHILFGELAAIQRNLDLLTASQKPDLHAILEFEEKYRRQVSSRHRFIIPPNFDRARKVPIDDLYVVPDFGYTSREEGEKLQTMSLAEFSTVIWRTVLLGDPGSGKSTLASKLCHDLAEHYTERPLAGRQLTAIHVALREYGTAKKETSCSIVQFIRQTAESAHQLPPPPPNTFEYLLLNGRAVVIFDGLDELLDTSYRKAISADIESFCTLYPSAPVLVTSRKVGYEQAPLDPTQFDVFHLAPFDEEKTREYVRKWFRLENSLTGQQQEDKATSFMAESRAVPDLRANPLLLALMCNIYRGEGYIPRNRPDVYEKCATMLFERWDRGRGIRSVLPFEAHIKPTLMYLAHWIYTDEKRQSGVTECELIVPAAEYLHKRRFRDRDEAEHAARAFIEFCRGRAWVFTDTGTTASGEGLYQFTHRTFLEYFTAAYIVRTHRTPEALVDFLLPRILKKEWDVVAQLAFQLQNKQLEGAGDELLMSLLEQDTTDSPNALSFTARCLEFMVPSPRVNEAITQACMDQSIAWAVAQPEGELGRALGEVRETPLPQRLFHDLSALAVENRDTAASALQRALERYIHGHSEFEAYLAFELGLDLNLVMGFADYWRDFSARVYQDNLELLQSLQPNYYLLCLECWEHGDTSTHDLVGWHGLRRVFSYTGRVTSKWYCNPVSECLIRDVCFMDPQEHVSYRNLRRQLAEIGQILTSSPPPWMSKDDINVEGRFPPFLDHLVLAEGDNAGCQNIDTLLALGSEALFGLLVLLATHVELYEREERIEQTLTHIRSQSIPVYDLWQMTLSFRYDQADENKVQAELDRCGLSDVHKELLWRWVRREIDLVK